MAETWRATEKAHRRERYLRAASHLFAERGFRSVSIEELGTAVGVSGPALYRHFASKDQMLIELLVSASERLLEGYQKIAAAGAGDLDTLRDLIDFHLDFAVADRDTIRIQDRELANLPADANHRVRSLQREYLNGWQAIVARLRPELTDDDLRVRMHALFAVLNSTPYSGARGDDGTQRGERQTRAVLAEVALGAVLGATIEPRIPARER